MKLADLPADRLTAVRNAVHEAAHVVACVILKIPFSRARLGDALTSSGVDVLPYNGNVIDIFTMMSAGFTAKAASKDRRSRAAARGCSRS